MGVIPPLCALLELHDVKVISVALEGLENILRAGESSGESAVAAPDGSSAYMNAYANLVEECEGVHKIQSLQYSENEGIYSDILGPVLYIYTYIYRRILRHERLYDSRVIIDESRDRFV